MTFRLLVCLNGVFVIKTKVIFLFVIQKCSYCISNLMHQNSFCGRAYSAPQTLNCITWPLCGSWREGRRGGVGRGRIQNIEQCLMYTLYSDGKQCFGVRRGTSKKPRKGFTVFLSHWHRRHHYHCDYCHRNSFQSSIPLRAL